VGLLIRYLLASYAIVGALMAWWFPAQSLIRLEVVDWGKLYERRYTAPDNIWGALEAARAFLRSVAEPLPLTEFIANDLRGHVEVSSDGSWSSLLEVIEGQIKAGGPSHTFLRPPQGILPDKDQALHYVEVRTSGGIRHLAYRFLEPSEYDSHEIPLRLRYPLRRYWPAILCWVLGWLYLGFFTGGKTGKVASSSAGKGVRISAVFAAGFSGMILWPFVYGTVGSGFSFASIFMGGVFFIGALVGVILFGLQASVASDMIEKGRYLARFTYRPEQWSRFTEWDFREELSEKKSLWVVVFVICLLIGGGFMAVMRDKASVIVFFSLMGFAALLWVIAVGAPRLSRLRNMKSSGEIYVGEKGIYLAGMVHSWNLPGSRFESAEIKKSPIPHILLVYSQLQSAGRHLYFFRNYITVRIPVPEGMESESESLVERLQSLRTS
jgi:multisubunit Na+/H+ antiporter MnhC subunit